MEEKTKDGGQVKLSYDDLKANFDALYKEYESLRKQYVQVARELQGIDLITILLNVLEHEELYHTDFVQKAVSTIEGRIGFIMEQLAASKNKEKVGDENAE